MKAFKLYTNDEDGAVTVDWVVLTAAVVGLGVAALAAIRGGTKSITNAISGHLASQTIASTF